MFVVLGFGVCFMDMGFGDDEYLICSSFVLYVHLVYMLFDPK